MDSTFTKEDDNAPASAAGDSTFVLESTDAEDGTTSNANSTFTLEDDVFMPNGEAEDDEDDEAETNSPKVPWRPATPPKKRTFDDKENPSPNNSAKSVDSMASLSPLALKKPLGNSNRGSFFKSPLEMD